MKPESVRRTGKCILLVGVIGYVLGLAICWTIFWRRWEFHSNFAIIFVTFCLLAFRAAIWVGAVVWVVGVAINRRRFG
jgi:hypothetical protein